jgi:hypothetical protein
LKQALISLAKDVKGAIDVTAVVVDVVLVTALIPVIVTFINNADNLTATETTLLGLTTLFIILALVFNIVKQSGLTKKMR